MNSRQHNQKSPVNLHIEELVLYGFPRHESYPIARAVEQELARLLGHGDIPSTLRQGGIISDIDGGSFQMRPGSNPETTGAQVAKNLYRGLNR